MESKQLELHHIDSGSGNGASGAQKHSGEEGEWVPLGGRAGNQRLRKEDSRSESCGQGDRDKSKRVVGHTDTDFGGRRGSQPPHINLCQVSTLYILLLIAWPELYK